MTHNVCFGFEKPTIWAKRRLTGLRSHERLALIVQDIMEVEVIHQQVDVVNTPIMIMMNLQRNTVPRMSTTNDTPPQQHHGNTGTMAAVLVDIALLATHLRILGPVFPGHTPRNHLLALMPGVPHLHREGVVQIPALSREVPGTQEISLVTQPLVITIVVLGEGVREHKEIVQAQGGRMSQNQALSHSSNISNNNHPLRVIVGSSVQVVRVSLGKFQMLNHLMAPNRPSSRVHNISSSNHCNTARTLKAASPQ